jgi:flagellar FliL protein
MVTRPSQAGNVVVMALAAVNVVGTLVIVTLLFISFQREKQKASLEDLAAQTIAEGDGEGEGGEKKEGGHGGGGHGGGHGDGHGGPEKAKKKTTEFGKMVNLDPFTINLSNPGSATPKFVKANISLEIPNDETEAEVQNKTPQIRNAIIDLFNSKRTADLLTSEGRDYLKEEIRNAINGFMVDGKIKGVYFTNFALAG